MSLFYYGLGNDGFCWHSFWLHLFLTFADQFIDNLTEVMI